MPLYFAIISVTDCQWRPFSYVFNVLFICISFPISLPVMLSKTNITDSEYHLIWYLNPKGFDKRSIVVWSYLSIDIKSNKYKIWLI